MGFTFGIDIRNCKCKCREGLIDSIYFDEDYEDRKTASSKQENKGKFSIKKTVMMVGTQESTFKCEPQIDDNDSNISINLPNGQN